MQLRPLRALQRVRIFEGDDVPFATVRDWDAWQRAGTRQLAARAEATPDEPVFSDPAQRLLRIDGGRHRTACVAEGTLSLSASTLRVGEAAFPLDEVTDLALCGRARMVFSPAARNMRSGQSRRAVAINMPFFCNT